MAEESGTEKVREIVAKWLNEAEAIETDRDVLPQTAEMVEQNRNLTRNANAYRRFARKLAKEFGLEI